MILILIADGARAVISFCILSAIPVYTVDPPESTMFSAFRVMEVWIERYLIFPTKNGASTLPSYC